jgi:hypothetical protein
VKVSHYARTFGTRFQHGTYYRGAQHKHWGMRAYNYGWRTWLFFDPSAGGWYYWCGGRTAFLPVVCLVIAPPTPMPESGSGGELSGEVDELPEASGSELPDLPQTTDE